MNEKKSSFGAMLAGFRKQHQEGALRFKRWTPGEFFMGRFSEVKFIPTPRSRFAKVAEVHILRELNDEGQETGQSIMTSRIPVLAWMLDQLAELDQDPHEAVFLITYKGKKDLDPNDDGAVNQAHSFSIDCIVPNSSGDLVKLENRDGGLAFP